MNKNWWVNDWFDCYEFLGIDENFTKKELKKAYHIKIKEVHPDNGNEENEDFIKAKRAYETLNNDFLRNEYLKYTKELKRKKEDEISFDEIVQNANNAYYQTKLSLNKIINITNTKIESFYNIYNDFCNKLKSNQIDENNFQILQTKLVKLQTIIINELKTILSYLNNDLKNLNLSNEKKEIKNLLNKLYICNIVLKTPYNIAKINALFNMNNILNKIKNTNKKLKIIYATIGTFVIFSIFYGTSLLSNKNNIINDITNNEEIDLDISDSTILVLDDEENDEKILNLDYKYSDNYEDKNNIISTENCILFQDIDKDIEFDEIGKPYKNDYGEVINAKKDNVRYLIDANDLHILFSHFLSYSSYHDCFIILGEDGVDYNLDTKYLRKVLETDDTCSYKSNAFYLDKANIYVYEKIGYRKKYLFNSYDDSVLFSDYYSMSDAFFSDTFNDYVYYFTLSEDTGCYVTASNWEKHYVTIEKEAETLIYQNINNNEFIIFYDLPEKIDDADITKSNIIPFFNNAIEIEKDGKKYIIDKTTHKVLIGNFSYIDNICTKEGNKCLTIVGINGITYYINENMEIVSTDNFMNYEEPFNIGNYKNKVCEGSYQNNKILFDINENKILFSEYNYIDDIYFDEEYNDYIVTIYKNHEMYYIKSSDLSTVLKKEHQLDINIEKLLNYYSSL